MRACAITAPRRLELLDVPSPDLGSHEVRIRPRPVGVCGTDLSIVDEAPLPAADDRSGMRPPPLGTGPCLRQRGRRASLGHAPEPNP